MVHDLFRETIIDGLAYPQRLSLHKGIADALEHRYARGATVVAADLARHCAAAVPLEGGERAIRWARSAAEDPGDTDAGPGLVDLLVEEADARSRTGDSATARGLLEDARDRVADVRRIEFHSRWLHWGLLAGRSGDLFCLGFEMTEAGPRYERGRRRNIGHLGYLFA